MAEQFVNDFQTTLTSGINDVTTTIPVAAGTSVASQFRAKIDDEIIIVTAGGTGTSWTATRGAEGTSNVSHSSGATVTIVLTDGALDTWGSELFSTRQVKDGLAIQFDPTPTSPNTEDDEFNAASLDAKWTESTNTTAEDDINTTWKSHLYVRFSGNQLYEIDQDYAPAGNFSLTARFTYPISSNFQQPRIAAWDDDFSDAMRMAFAHVGGSYQGELSSIDASIFTLRAASAKAAIGTVYLHLQRTGNDWLGAFSYDGLGWYRLGPHSKTFTVEHIRLSIDQAGSTTPALAGCDWIRRDWITL